VKIYFIYSTFKDLKSAKLLASKLVMNKLAAYGLENPLAFLGFTCSPGTCTINL